MPHMGSLSSLGRNQWAGPAAMEVGVGPAEPALCPGIVWVRLRRSRVSRGGETVGAFEDVHHHRVTGSLAMFHRMIFKGRLTAPLQAGWGSLLLVVSGRGAERLHRVREGYEETDRQQRPEAGDRRGTAGDLFDHVKTRNRTQQKMSWPRRSPGRRDHRGGHLSDLRGGEARQLPGPQAPQQRQAGVVPPGAQVPAPLPVSDRPRVRVHARAHPGVDPV